LSSFGGRGRLNGLNVFSADFLLTIRPSNNKILFNNSINERRFLMQYSELINRLLRLDEDADEAHSSALNERAYQDFMYNYEEYIKRYRPCEN